MPWHGRLHVLFASDSHILLHPLPSENKYHPDDEIVKVKFDSTLVSNSAEYSSVSPDTQTLVSFEQFRPHPSKRPRIGLFVPKSRDGDSNEAYFVRRELQLPQKLKPVINSSPRDIVFDDHLGILYWQKGKRIFVVTYGLPQRKLISLRTRSDMLLEPLAVTTSLPIWLKYALALRQDPLFPYFPLQMTLKACVMFGFVYYLKDSRPMSALSCVFCALGIQYAKYRVERNHRECWWL